MYKLRDRYTTLPLGYRLAVKCARRAQRAHREFTNKVIFLFPDIEKKAFHFNPSTGKITMGIDPDGVEY